MSRPVSALGGVAASAGLACRIEEVTGVGALTLRGRHDDPAFAAAVAAEAGVAIPPVRRAAFSGDRTLLWMSPDELMLRLPRGDAAAARARLSTALAGVHHLVEDVSDARATFRLTGAGVRATLAKGAPVDLARAAFRPGDLRRTHLGQLACAFWMLAEDPDAFDLVVFRSVAGHAFEFLATAAAAAADPGPVFG